VSKRTIGVVTLVLVLATSSCETPRRNNDTRESRAVAWGFFTAMLNHDPEAALRYTDGSIELDPVTKISDVIRQQQARTTGGPVFVRSPTWSRGPEWQFELAVTQPGIDPPVRWILLAYTARVGDRWAVADWGYVQAVPFPAPPPTPPEGLDVDQQQTRAYYSLPRSFHALGQQFTPSGSELAAVFVRMDVYHTPQPPILLRVRHGRDLAAPIVASLSVPPKSLPELARTRGSDMWKEAWVGGMLEAPVDVTPGDTYVLEVAFPGQRVSVEMVDADVYSGGCAVIDTVVCTIDIAFSTWASAGYASRNCLE
jgi:hypothetical protein